MDASKSIAVTIEIDYEDNVTAKYLRRPFRQIGLKSNINQQAERIINITIRWPEESWSSIAACTHIKIKYFFKTLNGHDSNGMLKTKSINGLVM